MCLSNQITIHWRIKLDSYFSPWTRLNYKCIKGFNTSPDNLNGLEEKVGIILQLADTDKVFLNSYSGGVDIKTNNWHMGPHKTKTLLNSRAHTQLNEVSE